MTEINQQGGEPPVSSAIVPVDITAAALPHDVSEAPATESQPPAETVAAAVIVQTAEAAAPMATQAIGQKVTKKEITALKERLFERDSTIADLIPQTEGQLRETLVELRSALNSSVTTKMKWCLGKFRTDLEGTRDMLLEEIADRSKVAATTAEEAARVSKLAGLVERVDSKLDKMEKAGLLDLDPLKAERQALETHTAAIEQIEQAARTAEEKRKQAEEAFDLAKTALESDSSQSAIKALTTASAAYLQAEEAARVAACDFESAKESAIPGEPLPSLIEAEYAAIPERLDALYAYCEKNRKGMTIKYLIVDTLSRSLEDADPSAGISDLALEETKVGIDAAITKWEAHVKERILVELKKAADAGDMPAAGQLVDTGRKILPAEA